MVSFKAKEISNPPRLSERLKNNRETRGLSLSQAAAETNIGIKYLEALEQGEYDKLPGEVYAKSFIKAYAKYLGLRPDDFLEAFKTELNIYAKTKSNYSFKHKKPVERIAARHLLVTPKLVRGIIIGLLALTCLVYLGLKISRIMSPPLLIVSQPAEQLITQESFIQVSGQAEAESTLEINGQQVLLDKNGYFNETIDLQPGVNVIELVAVNRHGRRTAATRQIILNQ